MKYKKSAQEHQAKGYKNCQTKGTPFSVGQKVLKHNLSQKGSPFQDEISLHWAL